jgi:o-succinylbenzoate synthase
MTARAIASRARLLGAPLDRALTSARATWSERRGLVLTLADDAGCRGQGEASPLSGFSRETVNDCLAALDSVHERLAPVDLSAAPVAAIEAALFPLERELAGVPAARFALETALLDLVGRRLGRSIAACLAGHEPHEPVPLSGLVALGEDAAERARALVARGVRTLKVKVGLRPFDAELAALLALRRELREPFALRLDANGAWPLEGARARLDALAPLAPEWIEEPTSAEGLCELGATAVPWAADESLAEPTLRAFVLERRAPSCAAVVLKPALLGGLLHARDLALRARAAGLEGVVTHLFDGPVAVAACAELALSLPAPRAAAGLDAHAGLAAYPTVALPQLAGAVIVPSGRAGLGLPLLDPEPLG